MVKDDHEYKLQIWDTAGQEEYNAITRNYYNGSAVIILAFDLSRHETFDALDKWQAEIVKYANTSMKLVLVGNKVDQKDFRQVKEEKARKWAIDNCIQMYYEVSSKEGINVKNIFEDSLDQIISDIGNGVITFEDGANYGVRFQKDYRDYQALKNLFNIGKMNIDLLNDHKTLNSMAEGRANQGTPTMGGQSSGGNGPGVSLKMCKGSGVGCSNGHCCI